MARAVCWLEGPLVDHGDAVEDALADVVQPVRLFDQADAYRMGGEVEVEESLMGADMEQSTCYLFIFVQYLGQVDPLEFDLGYVLRKGDGIEVRINFWGHGEQFDCDDQFGAREEETRTEVMF